MTVRRIPRYREPVRCVHAGDAQMNIPDLIDGFITWQSTLPYRANQQTPLVDERVFQNRGVCGQAFPSPFSPPHPRPFLRTPQFSRGQKSEKCIERAKRLLRRLKFLQLLPFRTISLAILFLKKIAPCSIAVN